MDLAIPDDSVTSSYLLGYEVQLKNNPIHFFE